MTRVLNSTSRLVKSLPRAACGHHLFHCCSTSHECIRSAHLHRSTSLAAQDLGKPSLACHRLHVESTTLSRKNMVAATTLPTPALTKVNQRKRKAHTKSRSGCGNCKIRRVKVRMDCSSGFYPYFRNTVTLTCVRLQCDEAKPKCKKCIAFGVSCNYGATGSMSVGELVLSFDGASCGETPPKAPISMNHTMLDLINYNMRHSPTGELLGDQVYKLTTQDLEVLDRFSSRTILTLGTDVTKWILQAETPRLAFLVSHNNRHIFQLISAFLLVMGQPEYRRCEGPSPVFIHRFPSSLC